MNAEIIRAILYAISFVFGAVVALNILATRHFLARLFGISELTRVITVAALFVLLINAINTGHDNAGLRTLLMVGVSIINAISSITLYVAFCRLKGYTDGGST